MEEMSDIFVYDFHIRLKALSYNLGAKREDENLRRQRQRVRQGQRATIFEGLDLIGWVVIPCGLYTDRRQPTANLKPTLCGHPQGKEARWAKEAGQNS